jgi:chloramphenicol-sensitive protein RarD
LTEAGRPLNLADLSNFTPHPQASRGALAAAGGFLFWGLVPLYWKQMQTVSAIELIAHRIVWSLVFLVGILAWQKKFRELRPALANARSIGLMLLSGLLLAANWTVYVWAVNTGHILESSLGYFLTPLGNIAMGYLFLHERLRRTQWVAIILAITGVVTLLVGAGRIPWIALSLATTWSSYSLLKKKSPIGPLAGLTVETLLLFPIAAALLLWWQHTGEGALGRIDAWHHVLVLSVGIVTAVPLLFFAYGAQRIRLVTLGLLQYLTPSIQFLIGLVIYHETFNSGQLRAYAIIWTGLLIYTADSFWAQRRLLRPATAKTA